MKKKILSIAACIILSATAAFAGDRDINKDVQTSFAHSFGNATAVNWQNNNSYFSARFQLDGHSLTALFATDGNLIAVSENILSTTLPASLQNLLRKNFTAFWVSDLVKYDVAGETKYYATVQNADRTTVLESIGDEEWSILKETDKR